jgi:phasin family protein
MTTNQFPMFDLEALLKQFSVPNVDARAIMEVQKKNVEALVAANQKIAESMQKIAQAEQKIVQDAISDWTAAAGRFKGDGDVEAQAALQTEAAIKAVEDGIKHMRSFAELVAKAQMDSMAILNKRMDESIAELRNQVVAASARPAKKAK